MGANKTFVERHFSIPRLSQFSAPPRDAFRSAQIRFVSSKGNENTQRAPGETGALWYFDSAALRQVQFAARSIGGCGASVFDCRSMKAIGKKQAFRDAMEDGSHRSALIPNR